MAFKLETHRLILRELTVDDANSFYELNLNPEVIKYTGDPPFTSVEESKEFLLHYKEYKNHGFGRWAVITKENNQFIGWCGLKYHNEGYVDLGFRFFQDQWKKGYATESAKACINYAQSTLKLTELIGRVLPSNIASVRVLEKLGFTFFKTGACNGVENALYYKLKL